MVGSGDRRGPSPSRRGFSEKFSLGSQRMDGDWPCLGLDQHENYSRYDLLCYCDSHWNHQTMAGKRSDGPEFETRPRQLPRYPQAPTGVAFDEAVLVSEHEQEAGKQSCCSRLTAHSDPSQLTAYRSLTRRSSWVSFYWNCGLL
jgi:hypothetical protein